MATEKQHKSSLQCARPIKLQECQEYCDWHLQYTKSGSFNELLTLMKYGLPQRKWISNEVPEEEKRIAKKLFGESNVIDGQLKATRSPVPFTLLCERKRYGVENGYIGENIGWHEAACDSFFPTPTDQGICMTENFNIQEVMHVHEKYEPLMESSRQTVWDEKLTEGTTWSKSTFVIISQSHPTAEDIEQGHKMVGFYKIKYKCVL